MDIIEHLRACAYTLSLDLGAGNCTGVGWREMMNAFADAADEIERLRQQLAECERELNDATTVMVAAAEEIHTHWDAHCDAEGYGPANLMRRLENGIATLYPSYTAGAFSELQEQLATMTAERDELIDEFFNCLHSDLENGVKWLNEKAADDFKRNYPALAGFAAKVGADKAGENDAPKT